MMTRHTDITFQWDPAIPALTRCPVLQLPTWDEEAALVALDWVMDHVDEKIAERCLKDDGSLRISPRVIREAMLAGFDPSDIPATEREAIDTLGIDFISAWRLVEATGMFARMEQQTVWNRILRVIPGSRGVRRAAHSWAEYVDRGDDDLPTVVHWNEEPIGVNAPGLLPWSFMSVREMYAAIEHHEQRRVQELEEEDEPAPRYEEPPELHEEEHDPFDSMDESEQYDYAAQHCRCGTCRACRDRDDAEEPEEEDE